jgi:hypothetical protein
VSATEAKPSLPTPTVRVGRLTSLRAVRRELARLYTDARQGNGITPGCAAKLAYVLTCCHKVLELEVVEERLRALEARESSRGQ